MRFIPIACEQREAMLRAVGVAGAEDHLDGSRTQSVWRLIRDGRSEGAWNMALDRAIQMARQDGLVPPTLRLYGWVRPTVTLGRFQKAAHVDFGACREFGVDVVRRYTGGRGVLHDDEITYSCVASVEDGVPRGVAASYSRLCSGVVSAYTRLGVDAQLTPRPRGTRGAAACYLHATSADVSVGEAKLSGSAQVWLHDTVLQHGSFVVSRDVELEARVFGLDSESREALGRHAATLSDVGSPPRSWDERCALIAVGWAAALGIGLEPGEITPNELALAESLVEKAIMDPSETGLMSES